MQLLDIFNYIKDNISPRLKSPYVSVEYSEDDKEALLTGLQVALRNTEEKELTSDQIIDVFNAMMPKLRANMKLPTRKGSVAFKQSRGEMSEQGIVELLEWAEKNKAGYGPRFEVDREKGADYFKSVQEMREAYNCQSNTSLAKKLFSQLKTNRHILTYIPSFDSFNPFFDCIHLTEKQSQQQKGLALDRFDVLDAVNPMFEQLIAEFNEIDQPYIVDIASFIKSMILLHPFPNGNGRVFTLGILNQLLLKNKFGICLNLEPQITLLSSAEIAEAIKANLIKLDEFKFEVDNSVAFKATCSELFNWFRQLREANVNNERLLAELEGMHRGLAQADTLKALSILKGTCEKIIELSSNHEINYPGSMPTAVFVLNTLEKQSGKNAFDSSYDSKGKNVFVLLMLSKSYIVHLKEELMLETKLRSHEEISRANPEDFNEQPITKLTLQKYQSVTRLCDSLEGEGNAIDKLKLFKQEFARNKTLLETRRDDAGITFLKIVLTIVTFSAAYFLGIWETKGKQFGNEVEALTNPMFNQ